MDQVEEQRFWLSLTEADEHTSTEDEPHGCIGFLRSVLEVYFGDKIRQSEHILSSEIADLEEKKEALKKEIDTLKKSADLEWNMQLRNRIEFLNAEVKKREEYIAIHEDRLRKMREAAAVFNDISATNFETYRQIYRDWQEVDRQLNERSAGIKQSFQQGDGESLVDTLTWVQTTIEKIPRNCIHANDFQLMTGVIQNALQGNHSGIRPNIVFQQEPNCVLQ
ncbi:uncharacterized protein LOC127861984 [Dreissena polymorpha]|uniref:Uncharacterized protein n=1 Tax=Dreissena polymorpha TaxID=45954 RepID=A0A9D3YG99_DREPO|nr:uncharacterized protein LOC127861984 [Dreissena polymorpha]XP_052256775.1 uncharacterized protein LOC127861984 [Dreissena polymorpha]KAH3697624.1 hypothetical protein DPMN_085129 [Dreissena polymorpha]